MLWSHQCCLQCTEIGRTSEVLFYGSFCTLNMAFAQSTLSWQENTGILLTQIHFLITNVDAFQEKSILLTLEDWYLFQIYDGFSESSPHITLERYTRPVIVSQSSTLVLVMSTGTRIAECCYHAGFKARFQFVSGNENKFSVWYNITSSVFGIICNNGKIYISITV